MRSVARALLVTTALALWQGPAVAQDFEPVPVYTPAPFAGAYIGATAGWVHAWADQTVSPFQVGGPPGTPLSQSSEADGWAAGLHTGYNWQFGGAVVGFETDFSYMDVDPSFALSGINPITFEVFKQQYTSSYEYFGTARGRLGFAFQDLLIYGTGGYAYAGVDHKFINTPAGPGSFSDHDVKNGWTAGGGTEWAIDPGTFLRVEALYVDLEDTTRLYIRQDVPGGLARTRIRWEDEFVVVRFGLSVKVP